MNRIVKASLRLLIGFLLIGVIFYYLGTEELLQTLLSTPWYSVIIIVLYIFIVLYMNAINIKVLADSINTNVPFKKILHNSFLSWGISKFLPGGLGEFSLIALLKKEKLKYGEGAVIVTADKLISISILVLLSLYGMYLLFGIKSAIYIFLIFFIAITTLVTLSLNEKIRLFIRNKLVPKRLKGTLTGFSKSVIYLFKKNPKALLIDFILTVIKMVLGAFAFYIVFLSYGVQVPFLIVLTIKALGSVVALIPIAPAGLGIKETTVVLAYAEFGVNPLIAASVYLLQRFFELIIAASILAIGTKKKHVTKS